MAKAAGVRRQRRAADIVPSRKRIRETESFHNRIRRAAAASRKPAAPFVARTAKTVAAVKRKKTKPNLKKIS
jgi:hypothetical protein